MGKFKFLLITVLLMLIILIGLRFIQTHKYKERDIISTKGVVTEEILLKELQTRRNKGEKIVFTNGCFDILHIGHVAYLEQAKHLGDRLIVAVNDDASVSKLKGPTRPINTLEDRMGVLAGLASVDWVISFSEDTPERLIETIIPDILVKGGDYKDIHVLPGAKFVLDRGGQVKVLLQKDGRSTSKTIKTIMSRDYISKNDDRK